MWRGCLILLSSLAQTSWPQEKWQRPLLGFFFFYIFIARFANLITNDDMPSLGIKLQWKMKKKTPQNSQQNSQFSIFFVVCLSIHLFSYFSHLSQRQNLLSPFWFSPAKLSTCFRKSYAQLISFSVKHQLFGGVFHLLKDYSDIISPWVKKKLNSRIPPLTMQRTSVNTSLYK